MLGDTLGRLAAAEPTELPFLSAYVDLTPELEGGRPGETPGGDKPPLRSPRRDAPEHRQARPGLTRIRALLAEKRRLLPVRGPARESFEADRERILDTLKEGRFDPASLGLAFFCCHGEGAWEVVELPVPVPTRLLVDRVPTIYPLARVDDRYVRYALCLADSQVARVYVVALGQATREESIAGPTINYKMTGGWSQRRIQERIANAVTQHIRNVAERLEEIVLEEEIPWIVMAGDEIVQTEFARHLSPTMKERVVETNRLDTRLPEHEAVARSLEAILRAEREEGRDLAVQALDAVLSEGLGAAGSEAVAAALEVGAVDTLLIEPGYHRTGWRCVDALNVLGEAGVATACPVGAGEAEPVELREAFVSLAIRTGAAVEFVEGSEAIARMGGVAALLRWRPADLPNRVEEPEDAPDTS